MGSTILYRKLIKKKEEIRRLWRVYLVPINLGYSFYSVPISSSPKITQCMYLRIQTLCSPIGQEDLWSELKARHATERSLPRWLRSYFLQTVTWLRKFIGQKSDCWINGSKVQTPVPVSDQCYKTKQEACLSCFYQCLLYQKIKKVFFVFIGVFQEKKWPYTDNIHENTEKCVS